MNRKAMWVVWSLASVFALRVGAADLSAIRAVDPRNLANGHRIPSENYTDQPYVVVTTNGSWVCVMTTGAGIEGQRGQHVVSCVSTNQGKSWSDPIDIEPANGPEASWATPFITPYGRIYVFYVWNGDEIVTLPNSDRRVRSDTHGWYVFRYSDDGGCTWSAQRHRVPIRTTSVDRRNPWRGEVMHFWSIDKPVVQNRKMYLAFTKLGRYFMQDGEGWIIESDNILTERDVDKIAFRILPEGDSGVKNPAFGSVQEEFNVVPLGTNALFLVNRLASGTPAQSISTDGGVSWTAPERMTYSADGRTFKTPRACPRVFQTSSGKYLFWYHNNSGKMWSGRNPAFLSGGVLEDNGFIRWSEPELVLFDPNPAIRMSYPDLIEQDGQFWITETQKTTARVHSLDRGLLNGMWHQFTNKAVAQNGLVLEYRPGTIENPTVPFSFGDLVKGGLSVELQFELENAMPGQTLFSTVDKSGKGVSVTTASVGGETVLSIRLCDGIRAVAWESDLGAFRDFVGKHHVVFIADFSAQVISVIADGIFCDGGTNRPQGWGRLPKEMEDVKGALQAEVAAPVRVLRLYDRAIRTSEAVGNFRSLAE